MSCWASITHTHTHTDTDTHKHTHTLQEINMQWQSQRLWVSSDSSEPFSLFFCCFLVHKWRRLKIQPFKHKPETTLIKSEIEISLKKEAAVVSELTGWFFMVNLLPFKSNTDYVPCKKIKSDSLTKQTRSIERPSCSNGTSEPDTVQSRKLSRKLWIQKSYRNKNESSKKVKR